MRLSARAVHGVHVTVTLARCEASSPGRPTPVSTLAATDAVSPGLLEDVPRQLRIGGLVRSRRGVDGGWLLARSPDEIAVAELIGAIDGPLVSVDGVPPEELGGDGATALLWAAMRGSLRRVLDGLTVADLLSGDLDPSVRELATHDVVTAAS